MPQQKYNQMSLKLKGDLDILKMYLYIENKVATLRHSILLIMDEICMANEKYENSSQDGQSQMFSVHHGAYSFQVTPIF